jgi:ribonucleoside-diphosphate reductase alpha chain
LRTESAFQLLERVKFISENYVKAGHRSGMNTHNVSATISVKEHEWGDIGQWMWKNKKAYNGLSILPYDGGTYKQAPFEDCEVATYDKMVETLKNINLARITEEQDNTDLKGEAACAGGVCEIV